MWPSDTGGNCVPLHRKRKYPCVQSSVTMDNLCVAPLVWAMLDCFPVQYKFLYYDEPCFLKEGTVPSVRKPGQGGRWTDRKREESLICSLLRHGEEMAKHIKASFRSPVWSVFVHVSFFLLADDQPSVWTEREHQVCRGKGPVTFPNFGRLEGLNGQEGGVGEGVRHLGIFVRNMKGHLCWGAHSALRVDCVLYVFTGDVWIFD